MALMNGTAQLVTIAFGTLPTQSFLSIHAKLTHSESRAVLDVMRRSLNVFGAYGNNALTEMLKAYGFRWTEGDGVTLTAKLQEDVDSVSAAIGEEGAP